MIVILVIAAIGRLLSNTGLQPRMIDSTYEKISWTSFNTSLHYGETCKLKKCPTYFKKEF